MKKAKRNTTATLPLTARAEQAMRAYSTAALSISRHIQTLDTLGYKVKRRTRYLRQELHKTSLELLANVKRRTNGK